MKKAALYIRVSTHHQLDKDSLPFQRQELINYSKYVLGIDEHEIFEDAGYSAKNTIRPAYQNMMSRIRLGEFSHLVVWKIDRVSRNLLDFSDMYQELKNYNVSFISKNEQFDTSNAIGEAMLKIILVFAELERQMTSERVSKVMLDRATKGLWNGAPCPLGYKWDEDRKFPVIDKDEAIVINHIYNVYEETESTVKVMHFLNSNSYKTKRGGKWTTKVIADILRNPFYKGTYRYNYRQSARGKIKKQEDWILVDNNHESIISAEQWEKCNKIMDKNAQRNVAFYRGKPNIHVLAGLIKCGECASSYSSKLDRARENGYRPSTYICLNRNNGLGCKAKILNEMGLGSFIFNYIANIVNVTKSIKNQISINEFEKLLLKGNIFSDVVGLDPKSLEAIYYKYLFSYNSNTIKYSSKKHIVIKKDTSELEYEKNKLIRALERLEELYLFSDNSMSQKKYIVKTRELEDKIKAIDDKISESKVESLGGVNDIEFLKKSSYFIMMNEISNRSADIEYRELDMRINKETLREFILTIIEKIIVKNDRIDSILFKDGLEHKFIYKSYQ
ncbi:recombinase family protein [Clostridium cylindrosporum]|uniref:Putative DNA recombinase CisA n=1 Tax=Clostridium cylindrosporum DSM 605 TaxID=1121307 RepID=A0A0J8DFL3_CLOCY|nr:recombinase family protein [Clostridium cylindrosporum]KMT22968.1 putative DNA recombinase CisA [Clostridium cylindrosporum DSM 605]